jgi:hypothetical protein
LVSRSSFLISEDTEIITRNDVFDQFQTTLGGFRSELAARSFLIAGTGRVNFFRRLNRFNLRLSGQNLRTVGTLGQAEYLRGLVTRVVWCLCIFSNVIGGLVKTAPIAPLYVVVFAI